MKSIYIYPNKKEDKIRLPGKTYLCFDLVDETGAKLDCYDYLDIKENVRIDVEEIEGEPVTRLYPDFGCSKLEYDETYHTVRGAK